LSLSDTFRKDWKEKNEAKISIAVSPKIDGLPSGWELSGGTKLTVNKSVFSGSNADAVRTRFDVTCRPVSRQGISAENAPRELNSFVLQAVISMLLIDGKHPSILVTLEPRALITNKMPISVSLKSPMPHVFSASPKFPSGEESVHDIMPNETLEIFTPGPSIAIMARCAEMPIGGTTTGWMDGGWVDLPLLPEFRLQEPLACMFPFSRKSADPLALSGSKGTEFFILDGCASLEDLLSGPRRGVSGHSNALHPPLAIELAAPPSIDEDWRSFSIIVSNYAVDHTGEILFEQLSSDEAALRRSSSDPDKRNRSVSAQISSPLGAFSTAFFRGRVSLLPGSLVPIRLLHLTMEGEDGMQRSLPFMVDDISISDGGVDSTPIIWSSGKPSGFFAYRHLVTPFQSEVHVIPEYIIYNGSIMYSVHVRLHRGAAIFIDPGKIAPLRIQFQEAAMITVEYPELGGTTPPLRIDALGLRMAIVSSQDGRAIGSFALQTVVGSADSRLAVKLGDIAFGGRRSPDNDTASPYSVLSEDFLRIRIRWAELKMTLNEARPITAKNQAILESALDRMNSRSDTIANAKNSSSAETWLSARERKVGKEVKLEGKSDSNAVCTILFHRFTIDWQRVFKDDNSPQTQRGISDALESPERAQLSVVIHNVLIKDESPDSLYPIVFDSTSHQVSFFDLCFRFRGKAWGDFVTIDLIDLNLAHANGVSEKIFVSTSEDFIWKLLDLADRIIAAAAEFGGVSIQLDWDKEQESFSVSIKENSHSTQENTTYTPPRCDTIYHIKKTRVSPFEVVASFKRTPQASRYKLLRGVKGANMVNYFTRRLKFKIDKAVLSFARYEVVDVKGPPDRIIELISTVYLSRMKTKLVTIMTAASFQDWKFLSARVDGEDEFLEGDILRATGNIAGNTAAYVLRRAGRGIGSGVITAASRLGSGIENATDVVGARAIGAGVNSLVTGVGEGVGDTITGGMNHLDFRIFRMFYQITLTGLFFFSWIRCRKNCKRRRTRSRTSFWRM
jgi:vacuolar protein sorting-associated protein 13A/C